ncbi:hypothetical protein ACIP5Y_30455 [Nocardia sp. NPDC088792]|uniref:hypothetical protein n=1 Tax=Nocardia sp. NPDC088792 TaxID=3364332 RepID=UPI0037F9F6C9
MRVRASGLIVTAVIPVLAIAGCTNSQKSSDATVTTTATTKGSPTPAPCMDENGHGPDGAQPCDTNPAKGQPVPLGAATEVPTPADAYMAIYAPARWEGAATAISCTATDASNQPITVQPPSAEQVGSKEIDGSAWNVVFTYGAAPGKTTLTCSPSGNGALPTDEGPLFVRVMPVGMQMR